MTANDVLDFWFGRKDARGYGKFRAEWFAKNDAFDREIRERFLPMVEAASRGDLDPWKEEPLTALALTIVLDQFPRNIFRGEPRMFASDGKALHISQHAVKRGFDRDLLDVQKSFFYMPLMHSENLEHQKQCVELFAAIDPASESTLYAKKHLAVIARFGRFPHRNATLGRKSSAEEEEFLKGPDSSF